MSDPSEIFPLPLTPFEEYMFRDGEKGYPMLFYMQAQLEGVVDRDILRVAVAETFRRHPLLHSRVTKVRGRWCWTWAGDDFPEADWDSKRWQQEEPWNQSIDLTEQTGIRVWAEQCGDQAKLTLQYHHACCDGIGASQFLQDIAIGYAREHARRSGESDLPELQPLDLTKLKDRASQSGRRIANLPGSFTQRLSILLKFTLRYLRQMKVPLRSRPIGNELRQRGVCIRQVQLDRRQTRRIRDTARDNNCSVNEVLVRELMLYSKSWNEKLSGGKPPKALVRQPTACVLVPASLRGPADGELPACNVVGYLFIARPLEMASDPLGLLESVRDELQAAHQFQAGWMFIQALDFLKRIPGGLQMMMWITGGSCMSTTVLSHMGNLFNAIGGRLPRDDDGRIRMGNLVVQDIFGVPPLRKGTSVVFSSMMVGGCLKICLRCCDQKYSEEEAQELVEHLKTRLERVCETTLPAAADAERAISR